MRFLFAKRKNKIQGVSARPIENLTSRLYLQNIAQHRYFEEYTQLSTKL